MRTTIALATITVGAWAAGITAAAGSLDGAPTCGPGLHVCLYANNGYQGEIGDRAAGGGVANIPSAYDNSMDSWWNETDTRAIWWYGANGTGTCNYLAKASRDGNIGVFPSDELTSWATDGRSC